MNRDPKTDSIPNIIVHQLKEKLGTKAVPTAELEYVGVKAYLLGERGIPTISSQFNITRWQNAVHCVSSMQRIMVRLDGKECRLVQDNFFSPSFFFQCRALCEATLRIVKYLVESFLRIVSIW